MADRIYVRAMWASETPPKLIYAATADDEIELIPMSSRIGEAIVNGNPETGQAKLDIGPLDLDALHGIWRSYAVRHYGEAAVVAAEAAGWRFA